MWVDKNNDIYEFTLINDLYDETEEGESFIVKRDLKIKHTCSTSNVDAVTQMFNEKGNIRKDRCKITVRDGSTLVVKGQYNDIREVVFPTKVSTSYTGFNLKHE